MLGVPDRLACVMRNRRTFIMWRGRRREATSSSRSPVEKKAGWSNGPTKTSACWTDSFISVCLIASSVGYLNFKNPRKEKVPRFVMYCNTVESSLFMGDQCWWVELIHEFTSP